MSVFFSRPREQRAVYSGNWWTDLSGAKTKAGVNVTPDKALRVDAMWSAVNLLASTVAGLPVDVFRGTGTDKRTVSPAPPLVDMPSLVVDREDWVYQAMVSLLLWGNAYGMVVERDSLSRPRAVEWLDPGVVTARQSSSLRKPIYSVSGQQVPNQGDILHMRAFTKPGSAVGMSPVEYRAETLGVSLAARDYGSGWFGDGAHPSAVFANKSMATIPDEKATAIKDRFLASVRGKREPLVVGSDWTYTPIQASAADSEFLNAMGYTDAQVARIYGPGLAEVLGYTESGSSLTYSNRVDRSLDLLTYTVNPWVRKFERFWTANIPQPQTARMNVNALLRSDHKTRHEIYRIDREIGLYNTDELRALEDLSPLPDGAGQDYTPLKLAKPDTTDQGGPQ